MTSNVESDGRTVTVTTDAGHRIGFGMAELGTAKTSGDITTSWGQGGMPISTERTVGAAKIEAEAYSALHHGSAPGDARIEQDRDRGAWNILRSIFGFRWR